ncbi:unnamed protein product [Lactuca saligna]|uniref:Uncharacterized protein n=1 Tax=Lactuca saligna TaxID=75948 RepID=A0AA36DWN1_LACSI|nr:unnamed protein product [Lactuca saligna]
MSKTARVETDLQKEIVEVDIPDTDTTTDQPILDTGHQLETGDYEGFLDLGTNSDIDYDNDQLNPRKRNASFLRGAHDAEDRSSSTAGDPSVPPPSKKKQEEQAYL